MPLSSTSFIKNQSFRAPYAPLRFLYIFAFPAFLSVSLRPPGSELKPFFPFARRIKGKRAEYFDLFKAAVRKPLCQLLLIVRPLDMPFLRTLKPLPILREEKGQLHLQQPRLLVVGVSPKIRGLFGVFAKDIVRQDLLELVAGADVKAQEPSGPKRRKGRPEKVPDLLP